MIVQVNKDIFSNTRGIYILSVKPNETIFKIGLSINLMKRLSSYHTCFPNGYYIRGVIILEKYKKPYEELTKSQKLKAGARIRKFEHAIHHKLLLLGKRYGVASSVSEWVDCSLDLIEQTCKEVSQELLKKRLAVNKVNAMPNIILNMNHAKYGVNVHKM